MGTLKRNEAGIIHNSTHSFRYNPITRCAYSYDWWCFIKPIGSCVVYNDYHYSNTTRKHQAMGRNLQKYDLIVETTLSLDNPNWFDDAIEHAEGEICKLTAEINKPRSRHATNERRRKDIVQLRNTINEICKLKDLSQNSE